MDKKPQQPENTHTLFEKAKAVRKKAHAPYSRYRVGAVLTDEHGHEHIGCNVENASFPLGACAEAGAISAMVAAGGTRIGMIAIVGGREDLEVCTPCGGCRQRIAEFADDNTRILLLDENGGIAALTMPDLLPAGFSLEPLDED